MQLAAKTSTATLMEQAVINFSNNTINNGKSLVYGVQLEGETYGCHGMVLGGSRNTSNAGQRDTAGESAMHRCECGKVDRDTVVFSTELEVVHAN